MVIAIKYLEDWCYHCRSCQDSGGAGEATSVQAVTQEVAAAVETIISGADAAEVSAVLRAAAEESNTIEADAENVTPVEAGRSWASCH